MLINYVNAAVSAVIASMQGSNQTLLIIGLAVLGLAMVAGAVIFVISIRFGLRGVTLILKNFFSNLIKGAKEIDQRSHRGF